MFKEIPWTIEENKNLKKIQKKAKKKTQPVKVHGKEADDLVGKVFGKLKVIKRVENTITPNGRSHVTFLCKCACGNFKEVRAVHLKTGGVKSCGCLRKENAKEASKKRIAKKIEKEVQKRLKREKKKGRKSFSFKFFNWTISFKSK